MLKIALVGQKGGSGKTTVCQVLINAILARSEDSSVLVIETDPQGSSASYAKAAVNRFPELENRFQCVVVTDPEQMAAAIEQADDIGFDYVVIDSAGSHAEMSKYIMMYSDRIIIPFRPVLKEYESQQTTVTLYETIAQSLHDNGHEFASMRLMLNNWAQNERMTLEQKNMLEHAKTNPHLADFYLPKRNYFETLDQGYVIYKEIQAPEMASSGLIRKHRLEDLAIADQVLSNVEAMQ